MKKEVIVIHFDIAKEGRKASRELFKGVSLGARPHKSKKEYSRKDKHRKPYE